MSNGEARGMLLGSLALAAVAGALAAPIGGTLSAALGRESTSTAGVLSLGVGVALVAFGGESWARSAGLGLVGAGSLALFGASCATPPAPQPAAQSHAPATAHVAGLAAYAPPAHAYVDATPTAPPLPRVMAQDDRGDLYSVHVDGSAPQFMASASSQATRAQQLAARDPRALRRAAPPQPASWSGRFVR